VLAHEIAERERGGEATSYAVGERVYAYLDLRNTSGAEGNVEGLFAKARGGILFLDEINSLPLHLQPKLLRAIEYGEIYPVGSTDAIHCKVRVITATNEDLRDKVKQGSFRTDLYHRINEIEIVIPHLTNDDVLKYGKYFAAHFCTEFHKKLSMDDTLDTALIGRAWPGGIREIKNTVKRAVLLSDRKLNLEPPAKDTLALSSTPRCNTDEIDWHKYDMSDEIIPLEHTEKDAVERALALTHWNISKCARALVIAESTLRRKIDHYHLMP
jgi:two-component system response regulator HydG